MVSTRSSKRPLAEADANISIAQPKSKVAKKAQADKENKTANDYAIMGRDKLASLARDRGLIHGGSKVDIIEKLEAADKNPKTHESYEDFAARMDARMAENRREEEAVAKQLTKELGRHVPPRDPRVNTRCMAMHYDERGRSGRMSWNDTARKYMIEVAKLRGLPSEGTKLELQELLTAYDQKHLKGDPAYVKKIIDQVYEHAPAYVRAVDILMHKEIHRLDEDKPLVHPTAGNTDAEKAARYNRQRSCKNLATEKVKPMVENIANQMFVDKEKVSANVIGGRLLHEILPDWVTDGNVGSYSKLHVGEMQELLRLRGEDTTGMKKKLIERLEWYDHAKYGGPEPRLDILRDARPKPGFRKDLGMPPIELTHGTAIKGLEKGDPTELHIRAHTALEQEWEINLPCDSTSVERRAEAETLNDNFGNEEFKVKRLPRQTVEELCMLRGIYVVTSEDDLRSILESELKKHLK